MRFKYLSESMTAEEAKKAYRSLAKRMHPDVGGSEEEFKVLANEYSFLEKRASESVIANIEDIMEAAGAMVNVVADTLRELYPRTRVVLNYTTTTIDAEISGNVPVERMLIIEQVINSFKYPFVVNIYFKREPRKSWITMSTGASTTWINTPAGTQIDVKDKPVYAGRRYIIYRGARYEQCLDKKTNHLYIMKRIPKYSLQELLGIGK